MLIPQRFTEDLAGVFEFYPHFGRPDAAPNITIKGPDGSTVQSAAAMTMTASTTTTAAAASGVKSVTVTAATGFAVDEMAYIINKYGQIETPMITGIDTTGKELLFARELRNSYASGVTIAAHKITYALTTTHTATSGKFYRAYITYNVGSVAKVEKIPFHICPHVLVSKLNSKDLYRAFCDLDQSLLQGTDDYKQEMAAAFEYIYLDITGLGLDIDKFRNGLFEVVHRYRTLMVLGERMLLSHPGIEAWYKMQVERYQEALKLMIERADYYDTDADEIVDSAELNAHTGYNAELEIGPFATEEDTEDAEDADFPQY